MCIWVWNLRTFEARDFDNLLKNKGTEGRCRMLLARTRHQHLLKNVSEPTLFLSFLLPPQRRVASTRPTPPSNLPASLKITKARTVKSLPGQEKCAYLGKRKAERQSARTPPIIQDFESAVTTRKIKNAVHAFKQLVREDLQTKYLSNPTLRHFWNLITSEKSRSRKHSAQVDFVQVLRCLRAVEARLVEEDYWIYLQCRESLMDSHEALSLVQTMTADGHVMSISKIQRILRHTQLAAREQVISLICPLLNLADSVKEVLLAYVTDSTSTDWAGGHSEFLEQIKQAGQTRDFVLLEQLFTNMIDQRHLRSSTACREFIRAFSHCNDASQTFANFIEELRRHDLMTDAKTQSVLVEAYVLRNQIQQAQRLFDDIRASGLTPSPYAYTSLINAYLKQDSLPSAQILMDSLRSLNIPLSASSYASLIAAYFRRNDLPAALASFEDFRSAQITDPGNYTRATLVSHLIRFQETERAQQEYETLLRLQNFKPDAVMLNMMMNAYIRSKKLDGAVKIMHWALQHAPSGSAVDPILLSLLLKKFLREGRVDQAFQVLQRLRNHPRSRHHPKEWLDTHVSNDPSIPSPNHSSTSRAPPLLVAYSTLIHTLCSLGQTPRAARLLGDMLSDGIIPNSKTIHPLLQQYTRSGNHRACISLITFLVGKHGMIPDVYALSVVYSLVLSLAGSAERATHHPHGTDSSTFHHHHPISSPHRTKHYSPFRLLTSSFTAILQQTPEFRSHLYNAAIYNHAQYHETDEAERLYVNMIEGGIPPLRQTLSILHTMFEEQGMPDKAQVLKAELAAMDRVDGSLLTDEETAAAMAEDWPLTHDLPDWLSYPDDGRADGIDSAAAVVDTEDIERKAYREALEWRRQVEQLK
ncbi:hypothetical protein DFS34DRAFT_48241 [Phlyctochytrium arcticum]|nr:hypothetical protein DFS34DRAFT_48241 [Phlyctochytrium arcticum]